MGFFFTTCKSWYSTHHRLSNPRVWASIGAVQTVQHKVPVSVEEYLADELRREVRHEYVCGFVYAMPDSTSEHNIICGNLAYALHPHLRGKRCHAFILAVKLKIRNTDGDIFYYPDLMVKCDPCDMEKHFTEFPKAVIEVLSPETERIDRREKFSSYTQIETLEEYVLVAQDAMEVTVFRRANNWRPEIASRPEQELRIPSLDFTLPLAAIYDGC